MNCIKYLNVPLNKVNSKSSYYYYMNYISEWFTVIKSITTHLIQYGENVWRSDHWGMPTFVPTDMEQDPAQYPKSEKNYIGTINKMFTKI